MAKGLLIICGGIEAIHGIQRAREMGLHVVVSDGDAHAPGFDLAHGRLVASTYDAARTAAGAIAYHQSVHPIDGVICMGADVPHTVSAVAAELGLPGLSSETAYLAMDKLAMKRRLAEAGVPIPWFAAIRDASDLVEIVHSRGPDLVVKPVDSRGGRGVQRLNCGVSPELAFERAKAQSPTGRVMVEAYLSGPQISTESILLDDVGYTPGFSDRNYELLDRFAPWFIENGGDLPSHVSPAIRADVEATVTAAARALGIRQHNYKGDMVVHQGRAHVIEIAARLSGGYFCTREIPLSTGVDFVGAVIRLALSEPVSPADLTPIEEKPIVQRYVFPNPGRIVSIRGVDEARALPGVIEILPSRQVGDIVPVATSSVARAAMILAGGNTLDEARQNAERAVARIHVETVQDRAAA
jgi:biotin carboxylase